MESSEGLTRAGLTYKLTWVLAGFSSLQAVGLRAFVSHWCCQKEPLVLSDGPLQSASLLYETMQPKKAVQSAN